MARAWGFGFIWHREGFMMFLWSLKKGGVFFERVRVYEGSG